MEEIAVATPHPILIERLQEKGIVELSAIQKESFIEILSGKSVIAHSKTGTGKTLAYLIPLVQKHLYSSNEPSTPSSNKKIVVLVPTRELATQVEREVLLLTKDPQKTIVIVGGESEDRQISGALKALFVVATPGRLLDLLNRNMLKSLEVETLVFDEADRLLDMGFIDDMREIVRKISRPAQQMLFYSATIHFGIEEMSYEFGSSEQVRIGHDVDEMTVVGLSHKVAFVGEQEKFHALVHFLQKNGGRGIVFSNYRDKAHDITYRLQGLGCRAEALTAQLQQNARRSILENFLKERVQVLVASDLAARGIDVKDLQFVVNYDLSEDPSTYVHRVGRTARAGKSGEALSFVGFEDAFRLSGLEKFLGVKIERYAFEASELSGPLPRWKSEPKKAAVAGSATGSATSQAPSGGQGTGSRQGQSFQQDSRQQRSNVPQGPSKTQAARTVVPKQAVVAQKPISQSWVHRIIQKIFSLLGFGKVKQATPTLLPKKVFSSPSSQHQGRDQARRPHSPRHSDRNSPRPFRRGERDGPQRGRQKSFPSRNSNRPK